MNVSNLDRLFLKVEIFWRLSPRRDGFGAEDSAAPCKPFTAVISDGDGDVPQEDLPKTQIYRRLFFDLAGLAGLTNHQTHGFF